MEPPSNHLTSPYGTPPCPPMYGPNTDYNLQHKIQQDQYYERQQSTMGYPGLVPQSGQTYPAAMGMDQNKMADPTYSGGTGYGRPAAPSAPPPSGGDLGPMMRALTEDDLYNQQQQQQQAQYRQMPPSMGYGQNMTYPTSQDSVSYPSHSAAAGQYPFSPGHSPRSSQFFPMHSQSASPHDGYTSPPLQGTHFVGPNGPLGQYQRQSPLMNMASPNGQASPSVQAFSRAPNHPVTVPSPVMGMQGSNMYPSHGNSSGHLSHNSPLPSPNNLRSPASVHSPKSLPASSPQTFASPSPSPIGTMAGQPHRQTKSPGVSGGCGGGNFQQNPAPQPYPIPSPKVRAVEQTSTGNSNTPYVELVSTRDSPLGSASNHSQESVNKAPYPQKEHSSNRGHLPQLEEMVKFLGEPTVKGILPMYDKENEGESLPNEAPVDINGRHSVEGSSNSDDTNLSRTQGNNESKSVSPSALDVPNTANGPQSGYPLTANTSTALQQRSFDNPNMVNNTTMSNTPNGGQETQNHPGKKSPRRRSNSKSPKRSDSNGQVSPLVKENHVGDGIITESAEQPLQNFDQEGDPHGVVKRRRSSSLSGSDTQKSPKRRYRKKSNDAIISKGSPQERSPKNNKIVKSPKRHSAEQSDFEVRPNIDMEKDSGDNNGPTGDPTSFGEEVCSSAGADGHPSNGVHSEMDSSGVKSEETRTQNCGDESQWIKNECGDSATNKQSNRLDFSCQSKDIKSENDNTSAIDIPSTSRSVTPPFKNPMTTPTLKRYSPESGGSGMSTPDNKLFKRKGRPPGSRNRTKEEIAAGKPTRKRRPTKKRLDPELQEELGKFKHVVQKPVKVTENRVSLISSGPVLRMQGSKDKVISCKVVNCPQDAQNSQNVAGKKQKKKTRPSKRFASISRVPQGPATMHSAEFRSLGDWVCTLCGKPANVGTLGHLYGPYYPHGYQVPQQPPKQDSTPKAKEEVEVEEVPLPPPSKGKGSRARLKSLKPLTKSRSKSAGKMTPEPAVSERGSRGGKGATGKRTPKTAKMDDFDYDCETPVTVTKGGRKRPRSLTPGSSSKQPARTSEPPTTPETGRRRKRSGKHDDPTRPNPNEIWVHEDCAIWAQGVYAMGSTLYGLYEAVTAARKVECVKCNENGASMGCLSKGCKATYHYMCAEQAGCQLQEENYSMICPEHKDKMVRMRDVT